MTVRDASFRWNDGEGCRRLLAVATGSVAQPLRSIRSADAHC